MNGIPMRMYGCMYELTIYDVVDPSFRNGSGKGKMRLCRNGGGSMRINQVTKKKDEIQIVCRNEM